MTSARPHLLTNQLPILLKVFTWVILLRSLLDESEQAKLIAYVLYIVSGPATAVALEVGDEAEIAVETLVGRHESAFEGHPEKAELFVNLNYLVAVSSVFGSWQSKNQSKLLALVSVHILILAFVSFFFGHQKTQFGGKVRQTYLKVSKVNASNIDTSIDTENKRDD